MSVQADGTFTLHDSGQTIASVVDSGVLYMKVPAADLAALHATTPWISFNLASSTQATVGQSYAQLVSEGQQGPTQSLAVLQAASASGIHKVGAATVDGTHTTEYRTTIDLSKLGSASGKPALGSAIQQLEAQSHVTSLPVEGAGSTVTRARSPDDRGRASPRHRSAPCGSADITVDIPAFDVPVNVTPPAAGQDTDETAAAIASTSASQT